MKHIYVVDDEKNIRELVELYLKKEGFKVTTFTDGTTLTEHLRNEKPDLIVLDIMLPSANGLDLCKEIRKNYDIPIIFISAKDEEIDRIIGLELGGDDYITKPFSPRELVARIKNIFKRIEYSYSVKTEYSFKDLDIKPAKRYVAKDNIEIKFTAKEYDLLLFMIENSNISFNREQLIERVWGYDYAGETRIVDDLIKRIRKKLKEADSQVQITTVWGYGYRVDD